MTIEKITKILSDFKDFDPSSVTTETTFEALGLDSLDIVDFVMKIEEEFGVTIPMDAELLKTVGSVVEFIDKNKTA